MLSHPFSLALDLGATSIGWSVLNTSNHQLVDAGVRIFPAAMDETLFAKGEPGASRNHARRTARLHRRQLRRRAARQRDLFAALQSAGLLPPSTPGASPDARHQILAELDARLSHQWLPRMRELLPQTPAPEQVLPYWLRARALDHPLHPYELGRALYHLGQRRGYQSNRKQSRVREDAEVAEQTGKKKKTPEQKNGDDPRVVEKAITQLEARMADSAARTLGEYFSRLDPLAPSGTRIRAQWTGRTMFEQEFEKIWTAQAPHHPHILSSGLKQRLHKLLFFQRPISAGKPGLCELEPGCQRAAAWTLAAQRFRLLQKVNDLKLRLPGGEDQPLTSEQRGLLLGALETQGDLTFPKIRELLALPKKTLFNLQAGGETRIPGNRTASAMRKAFSAGQWAAFSLAQQKHIVRLWAQAETGEHLAEMTRQENWPLSQPALRDLAAHTPQDGYSRLSARALSKLLPRMEQGESFKAVERDVYGTSFSGREPRPLLPPVEDVLPLIPNPAVTRALAELRKVVNGIIRQYGRKPEHVRIELARDLKRTAKQRRSQWERMRDREQERKRIVARLQKEAGVPSPKGKEIEKGLLFEELQACAYCGKEASYAHLFDPPQFETDHILPRNRFPDDSLGNKVLACLECNRLKLGRTPFEAFGHDPQRWTQIQDRIRKLDPQKQERILLRDSAELEAFSNRHLADTRYISKLAARYLEELYGGRDLEISEFDTRRAVYCSSGMVTATLRRAWGLDGLLPKPPRDDNDRQRRNDKPRIDHRHHAIDAIVIALSSQAVVGQLSAASGAGPEAYQQMLRRIQPPWADFVESIRPLIANLKVSHRPQHKLSGGLHDETNYGVRKNGEAHQRKPVHLLKAGNIADDHYIVDRKVRDAIRSKLAEVGDPKKFENNWPVLVTKTGKQVPIRRVRVRVKGKPQSVAQGPRQRHVMLNANHHLPIFETRDKKGRPRWESPEVVSLYQAMQRKQRGEPIVQRTLPQAEDAQFLFSLMGNDMVEMQDPRLGQRNLFVVRTISQSANDRIEIDLSRHTDARIIADMKGSKDWVRVMRLDELRERGCRKVTVDPLGRVHYAHD